MTIEAGGEAADLDTTKAAAEAALSSQDDRDWEVEARKDGWVPEEEFKGDRKPSRFKTAREFVEDGESITPRMKRLLAKQEEEFNTRLSRLEKTNEHTTAALKRAHDKEITELKSERRDAIKAGDDKLADKLDAQIDKMKDNAPGADKEQGKDDAKAEEEFTLRNSWYGEDATLTTFAEATSRRIAKDYFDKHGKQMPYDENLKQVEAKVKASADYKTRYGGDKTTANGHAAVDGGGENGGINRSDPLAKLPAEARNQAKADMKAYPKIYPDAASWLKAYQS